MRLRAPAVALAGAACSLLVACTADGGTGRSPSSGPDSAAARTSTLPATAPARTGQSAPASEAAADWPMYHRTPDRAGVSTTMPAVTGRLRALTRIKLDGAVYAAPIVVDRVTVVATENNTVYAFDSAYRQLWRRHLGDPSPAGERPCGNIDPLGITGTPVIDEPGAALYLDAMVADTGGPRHRIFALSLKDGAPLPGWPIDVADVLRTKSESFDSRVQNQRGALTILNGTLYVPYGGFYGA
jgi:hypothetical protein